MLYQFYHSVQIRSNLFYLSVDALVLKPLINQVFVFFFEKITVFYLKMSLLMDKIINFLKTISFLYVCFPRINHYLFLQFDSFCYKQSYFLNSSSKHESVLTETLFFRYLSTFDDPQKYLNLFLLIHYWYRDRFEEYF